MNCQRCDKKIEARRPGWAIYCIACSGLAYREKLRANYRKTVDKSRPNPYSKDTPSKERPE